MALFGFQVGIMILFEQFVIKLTSSTMLAAFILFGTGLNNIPCQNK